MPAVARALGVGELLDGAFTLYRRNFTLFFGAALLPNVPILLLWLLSPVLFGGSADGAVLGVLGLLFTPYQLFVAVIVLGGITYGAARVYAGEETSIGELLRRGLRHWLRLALVSIVVLLLVGAGLVLFIVPGLIAMAMLFAVYPAIMVEGRGVFAAMGRSRALSRGARPRILGVTLVAWFITMLPTIGIGVLAGMTAGLDVFFTAEPGATTWGMALMQAANVLGSALTMPFLLIVTVLLYYDRVARTEAPDLEAAAAQLQHDR